MWTWILHYQEFGWQVEWKIAYPMRGLDTIEKPEVEDAIWL